MTICSLLAKGQPGFQTDEISPEHNSAKLKNLVTEYFRAEEAQSRKQLSKEIREKSTDDAPKVARMLRSITLWGDLPPEGTTSTAPTQDEIIGFHWRLPNNYQPSIAYPTILCMPSTNLSTEQNIQRTFNRLNSTTSALRKLSTSNDFVFICPNRLIEKSFYVSPDNRSLLPNLVRSIRRKIHINADRFYLYGEGDLYDKDDNAGEASWFMALMRAHLFAGTIIVNAYPRLPYPEQSLSLLLNNVNDLPILLVSFQGQGADLTIQNALAYNRAIQNFAKIRGLNITGVELPTDFSATLPPNQIAPLFSYRQPAMNKTIKRWFRYPEAGDLGWLRVTKFADEVWEDEQISILPAPNTDRHIFITEVLQNKLGYLSGTIEGQTITIKTRKCRQIELLLPYDQFDWSKPIRVIGNGRLRHDKRVESSIETMLETAYETLDLQHPVAAKMSIAFSP